MISLSYHEWPEVLVKESAEFHHPFMNSSTLLQYPSHVAALKPYVPGLPIADLARRLNMAPDQIAKLASNENPLGASPRALEALKERRIDVSQYPDNDCTDLIQAIANFHQVPADWIVVGAGSESVIGNAVSTVLSVGRKTSYAQYSFQAYVNAAQRVGAEHIVVPSPDYVVDLVGLARTIEQDPSLIYIANPGNPTGTCLDPKELSEFVKSVPAHIVVLLDEAYFEFLPEDRRTDSIALVRELPNVLVTRTFSKAYGLAGLRVGYGVAQPALADMLRRARPPFTVTEPAQVAATAALRDQEFIKRTLANNAQAKKILLEGLRSHGIRTLESHTNFVLAEVGKGADWARALEPHGFIVRPVNSYAMPTWARISIGTPEQMTRLLQAIDAISAVSAA